MLATEGHNHTSAGVLTQTLVIMLAYSLIYISVYFFIAFMLGGRGEDWLTVKKSACTNNTNVLFGAMGWYRWVVEAETETDYG